MVGRNLDLKLGITLWINIYDKDISCWFEHIVKLRRINLHHMKI